MVAAELLRLAKTRMGANFKRVQARAKDSYRSTELELVRGEPPAATRSGDWRPKAADIGARLAAAAADGFCTHSLQVSLASRANFCFLCGLSATEIRLAPSGVKSTCVASRATLTPGSVSTETCVWLVVALQVSLVSAVKAFFCFVSLYPTDDVIDHVFASLRDASDALGDLATLDPEDIVVAVFGTIFALVDRDLSGAIDAGELLVCLRAIGQADATESRATLAIAAYDVDGSGMIEQSEFVHYIAVHYIRYSTVPYSTVPYSTVQYSTLYYSTAQYMIELSEFVE